MKIAPPQRQGVQSMGRHSIGNTGLEGDAAVVRAITDVGVGLTAIAAKKIDDRQKQKADLRMQKEDHLFWEEWGGRDHFDVSELPPDIVTEGMELNGRIAAAEVLPMMYEDHITAQLDESSKIIALPGSRDSWKNQKQTVAIGRMTSVQKKADADLSRQHLEEQKLNYFNAMNATIPRPDIARQITDQMDISDEARSVLHLETDRKIETMSYAKIRNQPDANPDKLDEMKAAVARLQQKYEEYRKGGNLDPYQVEAEIGKFEKDIRALEAGQNNVSKYAKAEIRHEIALLTEATSKGMILDGETMDEAAKLLTKIDMINTATEGEFELERRKLIDTLHVGKHVTNNSMNTRAQREQSLRMRRKPDGMSEARFIALNSRIEADNIARTKLENTDFMQAVSESGMQGEKGIAPLSFRDPNFGTALKTRYAQYRAGQIQFGEGLGTGMMTNQEATQFSAAFDEMGPAAQMAQLTRITQSLDHTQQEVFFEQLAITGGSQTFAMSGMLAKTPNWNEGLVALKGMQIMEASPESVKKIKNNNEVAFSNHVGNMLSAHPKQREAIRVAAMHHYIGKKGAGDLTSFNTGDFKDSIDVFTGGTFEYDGKEFINPEYNMPNGDFKTWLANTDSSYVADNMPVGRMSPDEFWEGIENEDYELKVAEDSGEFQVWTSYGVPLFNNDGSPWILKYDSGAPTKKAVKQSTGPVERIEKKGRY